MKNIFKNNFILFLLSMLLMLVYMFFTMKYKIFGFDHFIMTFSLVLSVNFWNTVTVNMLKKNRGE